MSTSTSSEAGPTTSSGPGSARSWPATSSTPPANSDGGWGNRIQPLDVALERSSARLEAFLASEESSPTQALLRTERLLKLAEALGRLPEDQRLAVELRYLKGLSVPEIAEQMDRTTVSVTGLLYRGTKALRDRMGPTE